MFRDRLDAGKKLAEALKKYEGLNPIILALPRGGVPIGFEVAQKLHAPLDIIVVRKIGAPWNPEFGVGAIAQDVLYFDQDTLEEIGLREKDLRSIIEDETQELNRRINLYRGDEQFPDLKGRVVILIDDGLATGVSTQAAIKAIKKREPSRLILAVPVGPSDTINKLNKVVDELICLETPANFYAVGAFYQSFPQVSDMEVITLLNKANKANKGE